MERVQGQGQSPTLNFSKYWVPMDIFALLSQQKTFHHGAYEILLQQKWKGTSTWVFRWRIKSATIYCRNRITFQGIVCLTDAGRQGLDDEGLEIHHRRTWKCERGSQEGSGVHEGTTAKPLKLQHWIPTHTEGGKIAGRTEHNGRRPRRRKML